MYADSRYGKYENVAAVPLIEKHRRYWGETKGDSGVTLQQLHELAFRRAQEGKRAGDKSSQEKPAKARKQKVTVVNGGGDIFEVPTDAAAVTAESPPAESSAVLGKNEETEELADVPPETFPDVVVMEGALIEEESGFDVLGGRVETERDVVHRHMPDWIAHPHLVEADIRTHSKPIAEFSLPDVILKNLRSMGISRLFPVQSHVIPHLTRATAVARATGVAPNDLLVCAPTGCGKTLCYVVPVSCALLDFHVRKLRAIVVLPTADVAVQVHQVFKQVLHGTRTTAELVCGELSCGRENEAMANAGVIVTTPGRLVEHLHTSTLPSLSYLRFLVVDEADRLLDRAHQGWLSTLLEAVYREDGRRLGGASDHTTQSSRITIPIRAPLNAFDSARVFFTRTPAVTSNVGQMTCLSLPLQKLLFSATLSYSPEHLAALALHRPVLYSTSCGVDEGGGGGNALPSQLREFVVPCDPGDKPLVLLHLVLTFGKGRVLCFTNSLEATHRLHLLMEQMGRVTSAEVSGAMTKGKRKNILDQFRSGQIQLLICSDTLARGMDFAGVTCVINYSIPLHFNTYLHRAGRTCRAGEEGTVYSILSGEEVYPFQLMMINAKRDKVKKLKVAPRDLELYKEEYVKALGALRESVADEQ